MAYFERHAQKRNSAKILIILLLLIASLGFFLSRGNKDNKSSAPAISEQRKTRSAASQRDELPGKLPDSQQSQIDQLAASKELRENVKIEKVWQDGTLSVKVGDDIVTVTSDGNVLYLPKEL